ncbi:uncharacterized protein LOC131937109 [Physella acuta]|uniref:uncharacterized protein LOC131937109 n=1 Tax=Physella acuta TaxID=109671 RepID=UPI0027DBACEA|nr:uncharacterized protein LOC131937109 [Physella acuta]
MDGFFASSVLVATWVSVKPLTNLRVSQSREENTFQAIFVTGWEAKHKLGHDILSENTTSYVIYIYQQGKMNWLFVEGRVIQIGLTTGSSLHYMSFTETVTILELGLLKWNTDYEGVMSYHTGSVKSHTQTCQRYLCRQLSLLNNPVYEREKQNLYKCPCTLERLGHQWQLYERRGPDLNIECYAISLPSKTLLMADNTRNKLCCYNRLHSTSTSWEEEEQCRRSSSYIPASRYSGHVLINDPWSWAFFSNKEALENMRAHGYCCSGASPQLCHRFHKIFPDMGCSNFVTFVPASAFGDPHITTLDGFEYTMNGWGEYVMMDVPSSKFMFQVRTSRSMTSDGKETNATVFTKLAAKEWENSSLEVELAPNNISMTIYINGVDYTNDFYSSPDFATELRTIQVVRQNSLNNSLLVGSFPCGVSIKVSVAVRCLKIEVEVEKHLMNATKGLLGNFNGNITDEFTLQNGTVLPSNMTESDILYKFAKNWEVTAETSIFTYGKHESFSDYQHPEFVPLFQDQTDPLLRGAGAKLCGEGNTACVYDFVATKDASFARQTKASREDFKQRMENLANTPPTLSINTSTLTSGGQLLLTQGKDSSLGLNVADDDGDIPSVETVGYVPGVHIDHVTKRLFVTPSPGLPISFGIRAKDKNDAYSPIVYISTVLCTGCSGHGQCDPTTTRGDPDSSVHVLRCVCGPAYTGADCESEVDACATRPCSLGQTCTDLTAAQQGSNTTGYICGPCPVGYTDQAGRCVDVDECLNASVCSHSCTNTEGSFVCSCLSGFRLDNSDQRTCLDINECDDKISHCEHNCTNSAGSYSCSCNHGYNLDMDGHSCHMGINVPMFHIQVAMFPCSRYKYKCSNVPLTNTSILEKCSTCQHSCILHNNNNNNTVTCSCNKGYTQDPDKDTECLDIDECNQANKPCSQGCNNTKGDFYCFCYPGYQLQPDGISCQACKSPAYGDSCEQTCDCKGRGTCDPVKGCVCEVSWSGEHCDVDVDECDRPGACPADQLCHNTNGSFTCTCPSGYDLTSGRCTDIDECTTTQVTVTCDLRVEVCVNTAGSYTCNCKPGYARTNQAGCTDIDECELHIDGCQHICHNVDGKYNCQCEPGYILRENRRDCISVKELCSQSNLNCPHGCSINETNQPYCICPRGYEKIMKAGTEVCEDIDECAANETNLCSVKEGCRNNDGSYTCSCPAGSKLDNDGRSCLNCTGETWGQECSNNCACGLGSEFCDPVLGCICKTGFTGEHCEADIDECLRGKNLCQDRELCINIPGSFMCLCQQGYHKLGNVSCIDIDECAEPRLNNCTQVCNNTEGSYTCSCHDGYSFDAEKWMCKDVDECEDKLEECQQTCANTEGSYHCSCREGFSLDTNGLSCSVESTCTNRSMNCSYDCANINQRDTCICPKGQELTDDGITCTDCQDGYYGDSCKMACTCLKTNTEKCNVTSGACFCKPGWKGHNCDIDVNECEVIPELCHKKSNSHCVNTIGSFRCDCDNGYTQANVTSDRCMALQDQVLTSTLGLNINASRYNLTSSFTADFVRIKYQIESQLNSKLSLQASVIKFIEVTDLRVGSLHVYLKTIISPQNAQTNVGLELAQALVNFMQTNVGINIDNTTAYVTQILTAGNSFAASENACEIRSKINPCSEKEICQVQKSDAVCRLSENDDTDLIIGLSVSLSGFVLICVTVVVLVCCWARRHGTYRNKPKHPTAAELITLKSNVYNHLSERMDEKDVYDYIGVESSACSVSSQQLKSTPAHKNPAQNVYCIPRVSTNALETSIHHS